MNVKARLLRLERKPKAEPQRLAVVEAKRQELGPGFAGTLLIIDR